MSTGPLAMLAEVGLPARSESRRPSAVDEWADDLYAALRRCGPATRAEMGALSVVPAEHLDAAWARLQTLGLLQQEGSGRTVALGTDAALLRLFETHAGRVREQAEELEEVWRKADALMGRFRQAALRAENDADSTVDMQMISDSGVRSDFLRALNREARFATWSMHPGPLPPGDVLKQSLEFDAGLLARGVQVRAVYGSGVASGPRQVQYLTALASLGAEVRLTPQVPFDLLLFDTHTALLPGSPDDPAGSFIALRGSRLMSSYVAVYEDVWLRSAPYTPGERVLPHSPTEPLPDKHRAVLQLLASGLTDEQIGRRLGISARTVGRIVGELMRHMDAASRFQMGVLAVAQGLVGAVESLSA